jgi:quercetin dioxygenase-like cupin family protein
MHLYPAFVYVLEGAVDVEIEGGMVHSYKAEDSFLEAINTWHNGKNRGTTPVKLLVVFAGVRGKSNLVRPQ